MTESVWVSSAIVDTTLTKWVSADVKLENLKWAEKNAHRHTSGQTLLLGEMPKKIFADKKHGKLKSLPDFCNCNGFQCMSQKSADVFSKFDLGQGGLFPVEIYQPDKTTVFDLGYHFLNFGAVKCAFVPEQSQDVRKRDRLPDWGMPWVMSDDLIAVSKSAFLGADLWTDPLLTSAFFVSDRLAKALKKEKLTRAFRLYRCKMVEG